MFIIALALGTAAIAFDFHLPWTPAAIVAGYGTCLLFATLKGHSSLSDITTNSPYFLGFILFLVSLFITFTRAGMTPQHIDFSYVVRQLGVALLTTIVGLPFRQCLLAYNPLQQEQDEFYRTLEEELRRSAASFKRAQVELVGLVTEFITSRKTIFNDEITASLSLRQQTEDSDAVP